MYNFWGNDLYMCVVFRKKSPVLKVLGTCPNWTGLVGRTDLVMTTIYFAKIDSKRWIILKETKNPLTTQLHFAPFVQYGRFNYNKQTKD